MKRLVEPEDILAYAVELMGEAGLHSTTREWLTLLVERGPDTKLVSSKHGTGKTTARALYYIATGKLDRELPRHERRAIDAVVLSLEEADRVRARARVGMVA